MSAKDTSSSTVPELPAEIWLTIFQIATYVPRETDYSATTVEPGLFCSYDELQARAFEAVLPLRRAIVQVSRLFYQIGAEILYTTFHTEPEYTTISCRRSLLFSILLVSRPELGRFVRRLSLRWSEEDEEKNYRIINHCPNVAILSSFLHHDNIVDRRWWRGLPTTIRSFDASVLYIPMNEILALLQMLPHLEILHLWNLRGDSISHAHTPVRLSALRILSVYPNSGNNNIKSCLPVLSTVQLPRLRALATNVGDVDVGLSFPLDIWRRLEYFKVDSRSCLGLRSDWFHNLRRLHISVGFAGVQRCLTHLPFDQLECLTMQTATTSPNQWKRLVELVMVVPLDAKAMPMLKLFQLGWAYTGIYGYYRYSLRSAEDRDGFIQYFETLVTRFEQRGVHFAERSEREICSWLEPVRDVLAACKRS